MPSDPACVFCKMVSGQIPVFKVYEDDVVLAFLDISPLARGHTLVIPKEHHASVMDIPPQTMAAVSSRLPQLTRAILAATRAKGCHVLVNNGSDAMQSVFHLHFHILPRTRGDKFRIPWEPTPLDLSTAGALALEIQGHLNQQH